MSELFERFPEMKPVLKPPSLQTVNGIGTMLYGCRNHDEETGTYVKTVWLTVLFVPILPIGAYRVLAAPSGGWYFFGKVPLSGLAKLWALFLLVAIAGIVSFFVWRNHISSDGYKADQRLARADQLRAEGKLADAALIYREVAEGKTDRAATAMKAVTNMLSDPQLQTRADAKEMAGVYRVAWDLRSRPGAVKDLFERGLKFAEARSADDPQGAFAVLEAIEPAAPNPEALLGAKQKVLEPLVRDHSDDVDLLSKLAVVYEQTGQRERCLPLLKPHAEKLGTSEGARVLGLIYFENGLYEDAVALLQPYADTRLKNLQDAAKNYNAELTSAEEAIVKELQGGKVKDFDYKGHEKASKTTQAVMVQDYISRRLKDNQELNRHREALLRETGVVQVALDLGTIRLTRAQSLSDAALRKAELEQAEKTFLAVRDLAGDQAEYRLSLGQVYYWLGKEADGKKLFDEVLKADGRKHETLIHVASLLRELGNWAATREMTEEAFNRVAATQEQRRQAAMLRALSNKDLDDEITWLERADSSDAHVRASLAQCRGHKAYREGKDADAATFYREAVRIYESLPENAATLNNGGGACLSLYSASGEREALEKGVRMMEKALALKPGDGILSGNVAHVLLSAAIGDLIGDSIDLGKLKQRATLDDLSYLYRNPESRAALVAKVKDSPRIAKARSQFERALVLAPKNGSLYSAYQALLHFLRDREAIAALDRKAAEAGPDLAAATQELHEYWQGKEEEKWRRETSSAAALAERMVVAAREVGGATYAVAVGSLVRARLGQETMLIPFDADDLVRLAEDAQEKSPSVATKSSLQLALLARAHQTLLAQEKEYKTMSDRTRRALGSGHLIAVAVWREGALRDAVLANADIQRTLKLIRDGCSSFPDDPDEWYWVMLQAAHPEDAAAVAKALGANELLRRERSLEPRLSPLNPTMALRHAWLVEAVATPPEPGVKAPDPNELLKRCAAEKMPLPFDLK